jgi:hypothetical protein
VLPNSPPNPPPDCQGLPVDLLQMTFFLYQTIAVSFKREKPEFQPLGSLKVLMKIRIAANIDDRSRKSIIAKGGRPPEIPASN